MRGHSIALWAGLTALFTNLAAVLAVNVLGSSTAHKLIGATLSSVVIGAGVYCKQRWDDARRTSGSQRPPVAE